MRVLHIQRVSGIGGSERHLSSLLPALSRRGLDVRMCVLAAGDAHLFVDELESAGVPTVSVPAGFDLNPVALGRLAREVRRFRPDLVHTHLIHGDVYGQLAAGMARVGAVSSFHASPPFYLRPPYGSVARVVAKMPRFTIAISEHLRRFLVEKGFVRPDRVRVIHYGMDVTGWQLPEEARLSARAAFGLEPSTVVVGIASRLVPEKGHAGLIDAMAHAVRRDDRLRLLVAGTGPLRDSLERRARSVLPEGSFRFCGFVDDVRVFLAACDIFTFPTTPDFGEGFGMAALEASAAGRPVIGTDVGPIPEVVADGESGLIVPARSPGSLANAIVELAGDGEARRTLGEGGARRAREVFGLDPMVDKTLAVYEEAVRGEGRKSRAETRL